MGRTTRLTLFGIAVGVAFSTAVQAEEKIAYTYDARGRLVRVYHLDTSTTTINKNVQACYKYDKADNRTKVTLSGTSGSPPAACPS